MVRKIRICAGKAASPPGPISRKSLFSLAGSIGVFTDALRCLSILANRSHFSPSKAGNAAPYSSAYSAANALSRVSTTR
jgi:hypothetical protein